MHKTLLLVSLFSAVVEQFGKVCSYAELLSCDRTITLGSYVMHDNTVDGSQNVDFGGQKTVGLMRSGTFLPCGSTVYSCEALPVYVSRAANEPLYVADGTPGLSFVAEVTGAAVISCPSRMVGDGKSCTSRTTKNTSIAVMPDPPSSGSATSQVVVRVAWAYAHGTVYSSQDCLYNLAPTTASADACTSAASLRSCTTATTKLVVTTTPSPSSSSSVLRGGTAAAAIVWLSLLLPSLPFFACTMTDH
mmetsp:Transcript_38260/g.101541  ORF Transcript_38260/g.101541 Transcript_38260/m.101541 type:complete len:247 (-) Transcript_38260:84-824(-)|eukprot:CAMPEP_0113677420 /NCGR_PEP_ID=MMETSP0038_2-20120614/9257_1 /TAXON_ID=2898 /ORGANISM="Cryptomonas paramecium" /LENGTH=246 /DNA_ID=CAMNT_0000594695 /DNA_START=572 /DNA_END=1312 /DNA_ORIENTATION=+ /assembly_acc=CAM_ASM_000170